MLSTVYDTIHVIQDMKEGEVIGGSSGESDGG